MQRRIDLGEARVAPAMLFAVLALVWVARRSLRLRERTNARGQVLVG